MKVHFFSADSRIPVSNRSELKQFIKSIFEREQVKLARLNYIFCSDDYLLSINRTYLKHDYYTDIITFDLSASKNCIEGEIYISVDRVRNNAIDLEQTFKREMHRVIFHGALHLCGYKDKRTRDIQIMRAKEDQYLQSYFK